MIGKWILLDNETENKVNKQTDKGLNSQIKFQLRSSENKQYHQKLKHDYNEDKVRDLILPLYKFWTFI